MRCRYVEWINRTYLFQPHPRYVSVIQIKKLRKKYDQREQSIQLLGPFVD